MNTAVATSSGDEAMAEFARRETAIAALREKYAGLKTDGTPRGEQLVRAGRRELVSMRGSIEKRRVELKADALEWGRKVDREAKRLTAAVLEIEKPLDDQIQFIEESERQRVEAQKRKEQRERDEAARIKLEAEMAARKAEQEAERVRMAEENARMAEERAKLDAERKSNEAAQAEARLKIEAEQRQLAAERAEMERERQKRLEAKRLEEAQQEAAKKAEEKRLAAEAFARDEKERVRKEAEQRALRAPDREKLAEFAAALRAVPRPVVNDPSANGFLDEAAVGIEEVCCRLERW